MENYQSLEVKAFLQSSFDNFCLIAFFFPNIMNLFIRPSMNKILEFLNMTTKSTGINLVNHILNTVLNVVKADYAIR